jgi:hypothetical protein
VPLLLGPLILFWVYHLVNRDDRHLHAHAMASDFSGARNAVLCWSHQSH